jgi:L-rhamnose mutarotase
MINKIPFFVFWSGLLLFAGARLAAAAPAKPALPADDSVAVAAPVFGGSNPTAAEAAANPVKYYASVVALNPAMEKKYRELHANVWPEVVAAIRKAHIRNYHIYIATVGGRRLLFSFFEYTGADPAEDFAAIAEDPATRDKWWPITDACQIRLPGTPAGAQWLDLEQVMFLP